MGGVGASRLDGSILRASGSGPAARLWGNEDMKTNSQVTPANVMKYATGAWAAGLVGAAVQHRAFNYLDAAQATVDELAREAGLSRRGAQALLDGLLGLGLVSLDHGRYANTPESSAFLVEGKPAYMGGFLKCEGLAMEQWMKLGDSVKTGAPFVDEVQEPSSFFEELVPAIAPLSMPAAQMAIGELGLATAGPQAILDVGGGSGVFSAFWLRANPHASSTQIDFPIVNRIAREYVGRYGVGDRFRTIDGDFHTTEFGRAIQDIVLFSHIAHMESPEQNVDSFRRAHAALKPGGTLVVNEFVLADDRSGPAFPLLFNANMLVKTQSGAVYREADYRGWMQGVGFGEVRLVATPGPSTLIFAKK
jgi:hypothetical protein